MNLGVTKQAHYKKQTKTASITEQISNVLGTLCGEQVILCIVLQAFFQTITKIKHILVDK